MLLAIDIGNSNIVIGGIQDDKIVFEARIATDRIKTSDQYGVEIKNILSLFEVPVETVEDVIISSVVPPVFNAVRTGAYKVTGLTPMVVGPGIKTGMNVRVDDPKSLGADILADCAGAYYEYGGPVLVADFGTATTFTHVSDKGVVDSGVITTGIRAGAAALWGDTAQLPEVEITRPDTILGTNTKTCMQAGLYYTFLGGVERTIRQFRKELGGEDFKVITTGGLGRVFENDTELIDVYDPDLIFKGMAHIYSRNVK